MEELINKAIRLAELEGIWEMRDLSENEMLEFEGLKIDRDMEIYIELANMAQFGM